MVAARPSDARRKFLAQQAVTPQVSNFFKLDRYYEAADKLYNSIQNTRRNHEDLDVCYVLGRRYCDFCLVEIPKHNYHGTAQFKRLQQKHTNQVKMVLEVLEYVATEMDKEETLKIQQAEKEAERLAAEKAKVADAKINSFLKQQQSSTIQQKPSESVQQSALEKLNRLKNGVVAPPPPTTTNNKPSSTRIHFTESDEEMEDQDIKTGVPLPPPLLPPGQQALPQPLLPPGQQQPLPPPTAPSAPPRLSSGSSQPILTMPTVAPQVPLSSHGAPAAPPSYHAVVKNKKYHPFFGPSATSQQSVAAPAKTVGLPMRQQLEVYRQKYLKLQQAGRIRSLPIDTYQGRVNASTNGCTVISALVAAAHLNERGTISNNRIVKIIDNDCGPILKAIRRKLGLGGHALIIPSDVHDHLVDEKILHQEYFAGVAGGNVLDPNHYAELLKLLNVNKKASATFFFREHVISMVRTENSFDLVDSLPSGSGRASRTQCADIEALEALLLWYVGRKFSESNCNYIDKTPWDDSMADLDPRVFQGFVWQQQKQ